MKPTTHVCLISGQPIPNLTPLLDPNLSPRHVVFVVTPDMRQRAEWLAEVIRPRGITVETCHVGDAWNYEGIQTRLLELLEDHPEAVEAKTIALNATGGTKLMSIAAYEVFRAYELPIFYVHPREDRILWLQPPDRPGQELVNRLRIEPFLQAHGAVVQGQPRRSVPEHSDLDLAEILVERIQDFATPLGTLNWLAGQARPPAGCPWVEKEYPGLLDLIDLFEARGKLTYADRRLCFADEDARFFVNGGWIEAWAFDQVRQLRRDDALITDLAYAVNVERQLRGQRIPNELDVVFLRNNRLHIIECKTRRFDTIGGDANGAEALYKLDSLRDLMGGLQARAMLVSFRDLPRAHRVRATDQGIVICSGIQLRRLQEYLRDFIRN